MEKYGAEFELLADFFFDYSQILIDAADDLKLSQ